MARAIPVAQQDSKPIAKVTQVINLSGDDSLEINPSDYLSGKGELLATITILANKTIKVDF